MPANLWAWMTMIKPAALRQKLTKPASKNVLRLRSSADPGPQTAPNTKDKYLRAVIFTIPEVVPGDTVRVSCGARVGGSEQIRKWSICSHPCRLDMCDWVRQTVPRLIGCAAVPRGLLGIGMAELFCGKSPRCCQEIADGPPSTSTSCAMRGPPEPLWKNCVWKDLWNKSNRPGPLCAQGLGCLTHGADKCGESPGIYPTARRQPAVFA